MKSVRYFIKLIQTDAVAKQCLNKSIRIWGFTTAIYTPIIVFILMIGNKFGFRWSLILFGFVFASVIPYIKKVILKKMI